MKTFPPTKSQRRVIWRDDRRRNLQVATEAVAAPITFETDPEYQDGYLLYESNRLVARWREPDHPGFAAWIMQRMHERHSALVLSRLEIAANPKRTRAAVEAGKKSAKSGRHTVEQLVRACLRRGHDPAEFASTWAEEYHYSVRQIRNIIKKIRAE